MSSSLKSSCARATPHLKLPASEEMSAELLFCARDCVKGFTYMLSRLMLTGSDEKRMYYVHSENEQTEAQRCQVT